MQPHQTDLVRIGRNNDGGYLVPPMFLTHTRRLITIGVSTDWSFEIDFVKRTAQPCSVILCDRSSGSLSFLINTCKCLLQLRSLRKATFTQAKYWLTRAVQFAIEVRTKRWKFYRRWITSDISNPRRDFRFLTLLDTQAKDGGVLLKIDIEGGELDLLTDLSSWMQLHTRPIGVIVEFHNVATQLNGIESAIHQLAHVYKIVHVHANNYGAVIAGVPDVIEIILAPVEMQTTGKRPVVPIPDLDQPNNPRESEIRISWE